MRAWIRSLAIAALLVVGSGAGAEQYNVVANAGNDGDSHGGDNSDPDAFATFSRDQQGGGAEFYEASADASTGSVFASASHVDPLPPAAVTTGSAAAIEETIHFDELPADSVTIRATLGVGVSASRVTGFANASARLDLGSCYVARSYNAVNGPSPPSTNCPGSEGGTIELVLTRDQLIASGGEVDISIQISAQLEAFGGLEAMAIASGGLPLSRGAAPVPGQVFLEIDPPLAYSFTGSNTSFPAPEPGAPLLLAAGAAALAAADRRRRRSGCLLDAIRS